jgi:hypothetical protein
MEKTEKIITLIVDVSGIIISLVGMLLLIYDQKYIAALSLIFVIAVLIGIAIKTTFSQSITYHSVHWYDDILDDKGHETISKKVKRLTVNEKNVTTIFDSNFATVGKLEFLNSNIGELLQPVDEGGTLTVTTIFKTPLEIGIPLEHIIYFKAWDSFPKNKENVSSLIDKEYKEEVGFHIKFPNNRPCKKARAFLFKGNKAIELYDQPPRISNDGRNLDFIRKKPEYGGKYILEWEW